MYAIHKLYVHACICICYIHCCIILLLRLVMVIYGIHILGYKWHSGIAVTASGHYTVHSSTRRATGGASDMVEEDRMSVQDSQPLQ